MTIIDSHTHVDESDIYGWIDPPEQLLELMDEAGIQKAVIMSYADVPGLDMNAIKYTAHVTQKFKNRLIGYARMNPNGKNAASLLIEAVNDLGLKGLKYHPESITVHPYNAKSLNLIKLASQLKIPVLFHTGDESMSLPLQVALAAEACPLATIIMAHMGGYYHVEDALSVAEKYSNIYLDTSAMPYPEAIKQAVRRISADRILFGSDGPGCNPSLEIEKITLAGLSLQEKDKIFHDNIWGILERVNTK